MHQVSVFGRAGSTHLKGASLLFAITCLYLAFQCLPHVFAGVSNFTELQYYEQVQAIARPVNASDPKLKLWKKSPNNPLISQAPQGGTLAQFRDPVTAWKQVQ